MSFTSKLKTLLKNQISTDSAYLLLLTLTIGETVIVRIVNNNENITYLENTYIAFPFSIDLVTSEDSKGEIPSFNIQVSALNGLILHYLDEYGTEDITANLTIINSQHLDEKDVYIDEDMAIDSVTHDDNWVTLKMTGDFVGVQRTPVDRFMKDFCPYKFKGLECGYVGTDTTCKKTLTDCRVKGNNIRFGGEPAIPGGLSVE